MGTVGVEWVTVMDALNLNSIMYHCIRKIFLSEKSLLACITKRIFYAIIFYIVIKVIYDVF